MKKYDPINVKPVEAVQWDGNRTHAQEIIRWVEEVQGVKARYVEYGPGWPDRIEVIEWDDDTDEEQVSMLETGEWLVCHTMPEGSPRPYRFETLVPYYFEERYREAPDAGD